MKFTMKFLRGMLIILITIISKASTTKYNVSWSQLETCKVYEIRSSGYMYTDFFHVQNLDNHKVTNDERLHLKLYVLTPMDAHILLSVTDHPRIMDKVYEVVIGAGVNTFSTIRTTMGRRRVDTNQDLYILSPYDPTPIEIIQTKDGTLKVYIVGLKEEPLLKFTDAAPLTINYISFSTFGTSSAKWFYDCQFDGFDSEIKEEETPLTSRERLIGNITAKAANRTIPETLEKINFAFEIHSVSYQQSASILNTRMNLILYWNDPMLGWDPKEFDYIKAIVEPSMDIWVPKIAVLDGVFGSLHHEFYTQDYQLKIYYNGSITLLATNAEFATWCFNNASNWPNDRLHCELILGLQDRLTDGDDRQLLLDYDSSKPLPQGETISTLSEWQFVQISVSRIANGLTGRYGDKGIMQTINGDISIEFVVLRNSGFYKNTFGMPIFACEILILLSFLLRGYRRGGLILLVFVILCFGMMFLTKHAPENYIPKLLLAYEHTLRIVTFCYLLHVAMMWLELYPPRCKPAPFVMTVVNFSPIRFILCRSYQDSDEYVNIQEHPWREISKMINSMCFIVINIIFITGNILLLPHV